MFVSWEEEKGKIMSVIFKFIGFGLMFVFLGILGVGVFLFYIMKKMLEPGEMLEVETDDWGDVQSECTRDSSLRSE
jgi:hypothetical protein